MIPFTLVSSKISRYKKINIEIKIIDEIWYKKYKFMEVNLFIKPNTYGKKNLSPFINSILFPKFGEYSEIKI